MCFENWSISSAIMKIEIRTALRSHLTPARMITTRAEMITNEEKMGNMEHLHHGDWNVNLHSYCEN